MFTYKNLADCKILCINMFFVVIYIVITSIKLSGSYIW